jgi:hypothetical protein
MNRLEKNMFLVIFMALLSLVARAEEESYPTFAHDNTYCHYNKVDLKIEIRSRDKYTDPQDASFGETLYLVNGDQKTALNMNDNNIGRYRLLPGGSAECSKALSLPLNKDELVVFMVRNNAPFPETLTVLYFNTLTGSSEVINTNHRISDASLAGGKLSFKMAADAYKQTSGFTEIQGERFYTSQKDYEPWMTFDGKNFEIDKQKTYEQIGKKFHITAASFFDQQNNSKIIRLAINQKTKTQCLSFSAIDGWKCIQY